jgi:hypothetical protein
MSCTIVLVHGAFAESASWHRVIDPLVAEGHRLVAGANPLRALAADAVRARAQREVVVEGASHAIAVSRPDATVHPIREAAALRVAA